MEFDPEPAIAARFEEAIQRVPLVACDDAAVGRAVEIQRQPRQQGDRIGAGAAMTTRAALARNKH